MRYYRLLLMPLLLRVCVFCSWSRTCRFLQPAAMESVRAFSDQQILSRNQENLASLSFLTTSKKMIDNWLRRLNRKELTVLDVNGVTKKSSLAD